MLPPLFPAAIGLVSMVAGSEEVAGRVISMLCGTALVGVLYALTSHVFNARTAIVVATLAAVHPLLIGLSVSLYSEMPWIFLTVCVAYGVVRSFTYVTTGQPLVAGLIAGLAYLVRPEGFAFIVYFAVALLVVGALQRRRPIQIVRTTSLFLAASLIVAAPNIVYLSWLAGTFRWEGKSAYNNVQNERVRGGMTVREAGRGLDSNGSPTGVFLGLHLDQAAQLRQPSATAASLAGTLLADPVGRMQRIVRHTLTSGFISAPWIFGLVFVGVVLVPWWRTRVWEGSTLLGISLLQGLLILSVDQAWDRYFFTLTPLLLMWAGAGLEWIATCAFKRLFEKRVEWQPVASRGIGLFAAAAIALAAFGSVRTVDELEQAGDRVSKEMGLWIAADARLPCRDWQTDSDGNCLEYPLLCRRHDALPAVRERRTRARLRSPHAAALSRGARLRGSPGAVRPQLAAAWYSRCLRGAGSREWSSSSDRSRVWRWTCGATDSSPAAWSPSKPPPGK